MEKMIKILIVIILTIASLKIFDIIANQIIKKNNEIHNKFAKGIIELIIILISLSVVSSQFEITKEISSYIIKSTGLFVAIAGFAAQQVLSDVISGMMIAWSKPFNIGERIHIISSNTTGIIEDITLRHTVIKCFDNSRLIIPNSIMNKEVLQNSNYADSLIGNFMEFSVGYESDIHKAIQILTDIILADSRVVDHSKDPEIDKELSILVKELGQNGILLKTTIWTKNTDDNFRACSDIRLKIKDSFDANGIEIPYNYIHVVS